MSAAKHTPGPWVVGPVDDTVVTHLGKDGVRYEVAAIDGDYNEPDEWPVMEANARLISAAPDLLEALKSLCDADATYVSSRIQIDCDSHGDAIRRMRIAREAIAKAEARP